MHELYVSGGRETLEKATAALPEIWMREPSGERVVRTSLRQYLNDWFDGKKAQTAPSTMTFYRTSLAKFLSTKQRERLWRPGREFCSAFERVQTGNLAAPHRQSQEKRVQYRRWQFAARLIECVVRQCIEVLVSRRIHCSGVGSQFDKVELYLVGPGMPVGQLSERRHLANSGAADPGRKRKRRSGGKHAVDAEILAKHNLGVAGPSPRSRTGRPLVDRFGAEPFDRGLQELMGDPELPAQ
jgi:hypothetical protein